MIFDQNFKKDLKKAKRFIEKLELLSLKKNDRDLIAQIYSKNLTYLSYSKLKSLTISCYQVKENQIPGIFIEAGCALGGSAILISSIKEKKRIFNIYDVFEMIPPPTEKDTDDVHERYSEIIQGNSKGINGEEYYGYQENLYDVVINNFKKFNVNREEQNISLIKGLVQNTLSLDEQVAFAHVDVDWYEPVKTCLERIIPKLAIGGIIILDDYNDWGGCRKATDEYFENRSIGFSFDDKVGSLKITRIS